MAVRRLAATPVGSSPVAAPRVHRHPGRLLAHRALVSLGHDEYWSTRMRRGAETARAHRVNLAFLGANAVYRHIRLQPSPTGPDRAEVNYKPWSAGNDPAGRTDPEEVTTDWRRPPLNDPESRLLGAEYDCNPADARGPSFADTTYYTARSGAGVLDAGTGSWVCQLGRACAKPHRFPLTARVVHAVTVRLLRAFARGPGGAHH